MPQPPSSKPPEQGIGGIIGAINKQDGASHHSTFKISHSKKDGWATFRNWLGKKNFNKFISGVAQYIARQMKKEAAEVAKAQRKLKASQEGKPDPT